MTGRLTKAELVAQLAALRERYQDALSTATSISWSEPVPHAPGRER